MNIFLADEIDDKNLQRSSMSEIEQERMIEAIIFASREPLSIREIRNRMANDFDPKGILKSLQEKYANSGFRLVKVLDGYAFRTAPDLSYLLQKHVVEKRKLSKAALEVLAIIAYHKASTRAEIEEIRGVSVSTGTLDLLMDIGWVSFGPRRLTPGRPITFLVTREFFDHFGLESTNDLPGISELRETGLLNRSSLVSEVDIKND
jgi:segregation and condensation protein B